MYYEYVLSANKNFWWFFSVNLIAIKNINYLNVTENTKTNLIAFCALYNVQLYLNMFCMHIPKSL